MNPSRPPVTALDETRAHAKVLMEELQSLADAVTGEDFDGADDLEGFATSAANEISDWLQRYPA